MHFTLIEIEKKKNSISKSIFTNGWWKKNDHWSIIIKNISMLSIKYFEWEKLTTFPFKEFFFS